MSEPTGERTEQATAQRMKEVREKGKLSRSQDLTAWLGIAAATAAMPWVLEAGRDAGQAQLVAVKAVIDAPDPQVAIATLAEAGASMVFTLGPMLAAVVLAVLAGAVLQGGVQFRKFALKSEHLDPVKGLKRTFGLQALWQGLKALLKTLVVGLMLWYVIRSLMPLLLNAGLLPVSSMLSAAGSGTVSLLQASILAGVGLAVIDLLVVSRRNRKHTRMTKQEVKDEHKKTDGDPLVRQQRRSRALEMSRNRMIAAVGESDVMLVNPTHIAVALSYQPGFAAPKIVALGTDNIALRLREEATAKRVPVVRDVALARALHSECSLGDEVPMELFTEVAHVLAFVMQLKERGSVSGVHTVPATRRQQSAGTKEKRP